MFAGQNTYVERIAGSNRYATAVAVRSKIKSLMGGSFPSDVILANGSDPNKFTDALTASAVSRREGIPILLVKTTSVPSETKSALVGYAPAKIHVMGSSATVSNGVLGSLGLNSSNRIAGPNRYETAVAMANYGISKGWFSPTTKPLVTSKVPDALSGGSMGNGPILLCTKTTLPSATKNWLATKAATHNLGPGYVLGSTASVSSAVKTTIDNVVK